MTALRWVKLICDGCDGAADLPGTGATVRKAASKAGWHRVGPGYDICPSCWRKGIRGRGA